IPILSGRNVQRQEATEGAKVGVVSERLARELRLEPTLGSIITRASEQFQVVGTAGQAAYQDMSELPPVIYLPFNYGVSTATVVVRTPGAPSAAVAGVREAVRELDP